MRARNKKEKISFKACYSGIALLLAFFAIDWRIGLGFLVLSLGGGLVGYIDYKRNAGYNRFLYMPYFEQDPLTGRYCPIVLYDEKRRKKVKSVASFLQSVQFDNPVMPSGKRLRSRMSSIKHRCTTVIVECRQLGEISHSLGKLSDIQR